MTLAEGNRGERVGDAAGGLPPGASGPREGFVAAYRTAVVSGVFCAVVAAVLLVHYAIRPPVDPLDNPQFVALQKQAVAQPRNEALKERVRELDLRLRREYFRDRRFREWGAWLLIGGGLTFVAAAKIASSLRRPLPHPTGSDILDELHERNAALARLGVGGLAALLLISGIALSWYGRGVERQLADAPAGIRGQGPAVAALRTGQASARTAPEGMPAGGAPAAEGNAGQGTAAQGTATQGAAAEGTTAQRTGAEATPGQGTGVQGTGAASPGAASSGTVPTPAGGGEDCAPPEEYARFWPRFRGPDGSGISAHDDVPTVWNAETGENIAWKSPVPLPGNNSPVVWEDKVFVTGADKDRRVVYCFQAATGEKVWECEVPGTPESTAAPPKVLADTGLAAPTVATDGRRVYAVFANGDVGAVDLAGKLIWHKSLGIPENIYGHASSLCTYHDRVIVQFDQGSPDDDLSKLYAFDGKTGHVVWEVSRQTANSWTTPIIFHDGRREQLITVADPFVISYHPADGKEWWRFEGTTGDCGPSPIFHGGLVVAGGEYSYYMYGIRADGEGDVTKTHLAWELEEGLPDTCSPLAVETRLILLSASAVMTCYNSETGEKLWEHEFPEDMFTASPGWAGGKIYLFANAGKCYVGTVSDEGFQIEHENSLGEECVTSPAFQPGCIFIRGKQHLIRIGR
ncbi:MAG: PQQ-binding-like beta-propeller repeat protein [Thermogutta sp.]|nr:PQQ-binding-like beta-propeller repeat protein [Thermogutta sp.]